MLKNYIVYFLAFLSFFFGSAMAALPNAATTAFSDLKSDVISLVDLAWTAAIPITIAFLVLRLFKKAASSAV